MRPLHPGCLPVRGYSIVSQSTSYSFINRPFRCGTLLTILENEVGSPITAYFRDPMSISPYRSRSRNRESCQNLFFCIFARNYSNSMHCTHRQCLPHGQDSSSTLCTDKSAHPKFLLACKLDNTRQCPMYKNLPLIW